MLFAKVARRIRGLDAFLKVILCIVLVVSLCPPLTGAFAGADEGEPVEPQATDTPLDASALEDGGLDVYADEDGVADVDADADAGAGTPAVADPDSGAPDAGTPSEVAEPDANNETVSAADGPDAPASVAAGSDDPDATAKPQQGRAASNVSGQTLTFEDKTLVATVTAPAGTLPEGATLEVEEVLPTNDDNGEAYSEAITSLGNLMRERETTCSDARVYDIRIVNIAGTEIEPTGKADVRIQFKKAMAIGGKSDTIDVAHLDDDGDLSLMNADVDTNGAGKVLSAEFTTPSFSYYIVFADSGSTGSTAEPALKAGDYGWVRFATVGEQGDNWGYYANQNAFAPISSDDAKRRITQVNIWENKNSNSAEVFNKEDYDLKATGQYFWTWENKLTVSEFDFPGYEVVHTNMHTAWDDPSKDRGNDSLIDSYGIRGWRNGQWDDEKNPHLPEGAQESSLNVLDIFLKDSPVPNAEERTTKYIVRYVHADGSISDGNVRYLKSGQSVVIDPNNQTRDGEVYSGTSIVTGAKAIEQNDASKKVTISYNADVDLAKVYIYYKDPPKDSTSSFNGAPYDKDKAGNYDTSTLNKLYTDKSATSVEGNDRQFLINLETWYVKKAASVGMVLDASGSMAWTSGAPQKYTLTASQLSSLQDGIRTGSTTPSNYNASNFLTARDVDKLLTNTRTDSSAMGYNGYTYYVYDPRDSVQEYVALGYVDSSVTVGRMSGTENVYATLSSGEKVIANRWKNYNTGNSYDESNWPGWYYVNSSQSPTNPTGKSYDGLGNRGHVLFFIKNGNELWCRFFTNKNQNRERNESKVVSGWTDSPVYIKRENMFTKSETLQDSVSQFGSILLGASPNSQIAMTRFSTTYLRDSSLPLLNWTSNSEQVSAALNQTADSTMVKARSTAVAGSPVPTYEYGLTGQTNTFTGVRAFQTYFADNNGANANNDKYLIIFTDGKDTNKDDEKIGTWGDTGTITRELREKEYKIITVLMRSQAMGNDLSKTDSDYSKAWTFLNGIADSDENGKKLYFDADSDNAQEMIDKFIEIADYIGTGLQGYTIRDYIDPRFDVVNESGAVLTKLQNGRFTLGNPTTGLYDFETPDKQRAYLGYDEQRKMFYVLWKDQKIPASAQNDKANVWSSQIRVQAKEDFLGGNDILSNGNEPDLNSVYKPAASDPTGLTPDKSDPDKYPHKDFPLATTNPATLSVNLANYEDTVFLGEAVTPATLYAKVAKAAATVPDDDGTAWYFDYLNRAGTQIFGDAQSLVTGLTKGTALAASKTDARQSGFAVESQGDKITLTAPYYYLENGLSSYAGGAKHQSDRVGTLTYTWRKVVNNHTYTDAFEGFTTDNSTSPDNDIKYELTVKYEPLGLEGAASGDDGSARTNALTQPWDNSNDYKNGYTLTRNAVGTPAATQTTLEADGTSATQGTAVVHVVDGRVQVVKEIPKDEYELLPASLTSFEFTLTNGSDSQTITIPKARLTLDGNVYKATSEWITHLTKGSWELQENTPRGYTANYTDGEYDGDDAEAATYSKPSPALGAEVQTSATKATIAIGTTPKSDGAVYPTADFAYATVVDASGAYKGVDRTSNTKAYLNAQIGQVIVKNSVVKAQFTIQKMLKEGDNEPSLATTAQMGTNQGITFSLFKAKNENNAWVKDDDAIATKVTDSDSARATFGDLLPGTYLLEEVSGTPEGYSAGGPWIVTVADGQATLSGANATAVAGEAGVWEIVNEKAKIALRINKTATQSGSTAKVPLAGAKFELRADANGQPGTTRIEWYTSQETTAANIGTELTTAMGSGEQASKAIATAYGLKPGTTFWIVETSAPSGYTIADPVKVVLSAEGNATFYTKNQATGQYEATSTLQLSQAKNSTFETEIVDSAVYSLPSAGGLGILEFLFLGAFIMTFVAGLARHTRREPARPRTAARPAPGRR